SVPPDLAKYAPQVTVRHTDRPEGREDLEARGAVLDRLADFPDGLRRDLARQDVVEGEVGIGMSAEDGAPALDRLRDPYARGGRVRRQRQVTSEIDDRGDAA